MVRPNVSRPQSIRSSPRLSPPLARVRSRTPALRAPEARSSLSAVGGTFHAEDELERREPLAQARELSDALLVRDDGASAAVLQPELEGLLAEQGEERHRDETGLVRRDVGDGGLVALPEEDSDAIA